MASNPHLFVGFLSVPLPAVPPLSPLSPVSGSVEFSIYVQEAEVKIGEKPVFKNELKCTRPTLSRPSTAARLQRTRAGMGIVWQELCLGLWN